jgi:hypothetical protein
MVFLKSAKLGSASALPLLVLVLLVSVGWCQRQNGCSVEIVVDPFLHDHLRETFYKQR